MCSTSSASLAVLDFRDTGNLQPPCFSPGSDPTWMILSHLTLKVGGGLDSSLNGLTSSISSSPPPPPPTSLLLSCSAFCLLGFLGFEVCIVLATWRQQKVCMLALIDSYTQSVMDWQAHTFHPGLASPRAHRALIVLTQLPWKSQMQFYKI